METQNLLFVNTTHVKTTRQKQWALSSPVSLWFPLPSFGHRLRVTVCQPNLSNQQI